MAGADSVRRRMRKDEVGEVVGGQKKQTHRRSAKGSHGQIPIVLGSGRHKC